MISARRRNPFLGKSRKGPVALGIHEGSVSDETSSSPLLPKPVGENVGSTSVVPGGRRGDEAFAELKGEFALDVVPTNHYGANSAWQQLSILAYNLARNFQLDTLATPKLRSRKRTYAYLLRSMRTLRFLLIARAGRVTRIGGRNVLRLAHNPATEALYARVEHALSA